MGDLSCRTLDWRCRANKRPLQDQAAPAREHRRTWPLRWRWGRRPAWLPTCFRSAWSFTRSFFGRRPEWESAGGNQFVKSPASGKSSRTQRALGQLCLDCLEPVPGRRPFSALKVKDRFERDVSGPYGRTKAALKAARWGILASVGLAAAATAATLLATSPGDGRVRAEISGVAADWSRNRHLLARQSGPIRCMYPSQDGRTVRVIWGHPLEAAVINLADGKVSPWPLAPETYAGQRCPQWSADSQSVLFTAGFLPRS